MPKICTTSLSHGSHIPIPVSYIGDTCTGLIFELPLSLNGKANQLKETNHPKENWIPYHFNSGIVVDIGKAERKLILQSKPIPN